MRDDVREKPDLRVFVNWRAARAHARKDKIVILTTTRRTLLLAAIVAASVGGPAAAEPDVVVDPFDMTPGDRIAALATDFDGDQREDVVELRVSENPDRPDAADLVITFGSGADGPLFKRSLGWRGAMYGTQPRLALGPQGSLLITFENTAIGRFRWSQTLTVAYRDDALYVAGYTFTAYDTVEPYELSCDANLFTGDGVRNGAAFQVEPRRVMLADWSAADAPAPCVPEP